MDKPPIGADCASAAMVNLPIARIFASRSFIIGGSLPFGRLIRLVSSEAALSTHAKRRDELAQKKVMAFPGRGRTGLFADCEQLTPGKP